MKKDNISDAMGKIDDKFLEEANEVRNKVRNIEDYKKKRGLTRRFGAIAASVAVLAVGLIGTYAVIDTTRNSDRPKEGIMADNSRGIDAGTNMGEIGNYEIASVNYEEKALYPAFAESLMAEESSDDSTESFSMDSSVDEEIYQNERKARFDAIAQVGDSLDDFYRSSTRIMLTTDESKNVLYSPVNVYMAMAMLAEVSEGNSRKQVLDALGVSSIDELRKQAKNVFDATYREEGIITTKPACSLWLSDKVSYKEDVLNKIAEDYKASSYKGPMGDPNYDNVLRYWLNEHTGNMLEDTVNNVELPKDGLIALFSTLYYKAAWQNEFYAEETKPDKFYTSDKGLASGDNVTCDFMHLSMSMSYYDYDDFIAVTLYTKAGGEMLFALPKEGVSLNVLLKTDDIFDLIKDEDNSDRMKRAMVNLSVPKFDVESTTELEKPLTALGIKDVFDSKKADFSGALKDSKKAALSGASHSVRVKIDEEGCEAAALTEMLCGATAMPEEEINIDFNRPFLFVVISDTREPLFIGTVREP